MLGTASCSNGNMAAYSKMKIKYGLQINCIINMTKLNQYNFIRLLENPLTLYPFVLKIYLVDFSHK